MPGGKKEEALDDFLSKDENGSPSIKPTLVVFLLVLLLVHGNVVDPTVGYYPAGWFRNNTGETLKDGVELDALSHLELN